MIYTGLEHMNEKVKGSLADAMRNISPVKRKELIDGLGDIDLQRSVGRATRVKSARDLILKSEGNIVLGVFIDAETNKEILAGYKPTVGPVLDIKLGTVIKDGQEIKINKSAAALSWTAWLNAVQDVYVIKEKDIVSAKDLRQSRAEKKGIRISKVSTVKELREWVISNFDKEFHVTNSVNNNPEIVVQTKSDMDEIRKSLIMNHRFQLVEENDSEASIYSKTMGVRVKVNKKGSFLQKGIIFTFSLASDTQSDEIDAKSADGIAELLQRNLNDLTIDMAKNIVSKYNLTDGYFAERLAYHLTKDSMKVAVGNAQKEAIDEYYKKNPVESPKATEKAKPKKKASTKLYTYKQLSAKAKKYALEEYRAMVEDDEAPESEAIDYYMTMGDGQGGPSLFRADGTEVDPNGDETDAHRGITYTTTQVYKA